MYSFSETQKFRQWWVWAIVLLPCLGVMAVFMFAQPAEKNDLGMDVWVVMTLVSFISISIILLLKLQTQIDAEKIRFKFSPFHFKYREIDWFDIEKAYIRTYNPLREYGGWGIRYGGKKGKAYNVRGNMGLQLELSNGKKILLGTQKPGELNEFLLKIRKHKQ